MIGPIMAQIQDPWTNTDLNKDQNPTGKDIFLNENPTEKDIFLNDYSDWWKMIYITFTYFHVQNSEL